MSKTQELLEAHIRFELQNWETAKLAQSIETELTLFNNWLDTILLEEIVDQNKLITYIQKGIEEYPLQNEIFKILQRGIHKIHTGLASSDVQIESVMSRKDFEALFRVFLSMKELRQDITHTVIHSPAYSKLISEILYKSLKDFFVNENVIAKKIPGASSFLKFGQDLLNITGMEEGIDKKLTQFIHDNIHDTVKQSEKFMDREFDKELPEQIIQETWQFLSQHNSSRISEYITKKNIDDILEIGKNIALQNQKSSFVQNIVKDLTEDFFVYYKGKTVGFVLSELGYSGEKHIPEIVKIVSSVLEKQPVQKYIEKRIYARLEAFYHSQEVEKILGT